MFSKRGFFVGLVVLPLLALGVFFVFKNLPVAERGFENSQNAINEKITPTYPFMDLTVPYLRDRKYVSHMGALEEVSKNSNYISYLTSYESDTFRVNGLLTKPTVDMPSGGFPAIVFIHGYIPPTLYKSQENYAAYVDYLAKNGFVVFKIDLRGHADSEGIASGAYYSGDYIIDALNAKAALESLDFVKKGAVGLWGHSMAGNVVFRAFAADMQIPAVVIWAGAVYSYSDFRQFGIEDNSYRPPGDNSERARKRKELFDKYGEFNADSDFWKQVPATNYLNGINGSVQIHHAKDDNVVDIGYSRNLISILSKTNIPYELFEYESGGHNLSGSSFNLAMQRTVEFFKKTLD